MALLLILGVLLNFSGSQLPQYKIKGLLWSECLCPPQNSYVEILMPNVMVLDVGTSGGD